MEPEYVGYIKQTKKGYFRCALGTLHDVGEPDGDKVVHEILTSDIFDTLPEAIDELVENCNKSDIGKYSITPIRRGQILFESGLIFVENESA